MADQTPPVDPEAAVETLEDGDDEARASLGERLAVADPTERKRAIVAVREALDDPGDAGPDAGETALAHGAGANLARFLRDDDRSVRLATAKLFVRVAATAPAAVDDAVPTLADRLADDGEFYYVRARCAEALGYAAVERPGEVATPELLADLRVGLAFDEPEVRRKLAKALAAVAIGDPTRLAHQIASLADHLDDEEPLVRYHLCTALVVVGCERPARLSAAADALAARLADEEPYVRGRAAEALGLLARADEASRPTGDDPSPSVDLRAALADALENADADDEAAAFLRTRVRFAEAALDADGEERAGEERGPEEGSAPDGVASVAAVREHTDAVVEAMVTPEDGECPHCAAPLPDGELPMCPHCGAPR
ncbi:hypothetical protein GCM10027435_22340 [Haloparvum alkalitolerans]|uniref:HEAT repeat domain-containing protein n=1 Tax=Haloparvum alkalitolerans TaxID=1042953 RepID=UPI003CEEE4DD